MKSAPQIKNRNSQTSNLSHNRKKMQYHLDKITDLQIELDLHEEKVLDCMRQERKFGFRNVR